MYLYLLMVLLRNNGAIATQVIVNGKVDGPWLNGAGDW
jgi:hypothetical protein